MRNLRTTGFEQHLSVKKRDGSEAGKEGTLWGKGGKIKVLQPGRYNTSFSFTYWC